MKRDLLPLEKQLAKFFGEPYDTDEYYFHSVFKRSHKNNFCITLFFDTELNPSASLYLAQEDKTLFDIDYREFISIESSTDKLILDLEDKRQIVLCEEDWGFSVKINPIVK